MSEQELEALIQRITEARDYAHGQARQYFEKADRAKESGDDSLAWNLRGSTERSIGRALNVILGRDPMEGDSTPPDGLPPQG
jgi:hypothetical protein